MNNTWSFLFYLVFFASASALFPFTALYYQSIGLNGGQIGMLTGMAPLITLIGAPLWTGIADATHRHRIVLSLTILASMGCALAIPSMRSFRLLLLTVSIYTLAAAPIISLGDSATMSMLGARRDLYSRVRLGGTIGWGVMAFIAGRIIDQRGIAWAYWIYAAGLILTLIVAQGLRFEKVEMGHTFWSGIGILLADRRWMTFLGLAFVCGVGIASINIYQFVYLAEIGASETLMGLSLTISTISELPVMLFGGRLLKRFQARGLMTLGMAAIGVRLLLYAAFNYPAAILLLQLLHGLTFPTIWIAGVAYAQENAPGGLGATGQGLFGAMMGGLGTAVGGFLGGLLIELASGRVMYLLFGGVVLAGALVLSAIQRLTPAYSQKPAGGQGLDE